MRYIIAVVSLMLMVQPSVGHGDGHRGEHTHGEQHGAVDGGLMAGGGDGVGVRGASGLTAYSVQLHTHGSFSEGNASIHSHALSAEEVGVDAIWWTDHDNHISLNAKSSHLSFDVLNEPVWANEVWIPVGNSVRMLTNKLQEYTDPVGFISASGGIDGAIVLGGVGSLRLEASWAGSVRTPYWWYINSASERSMRTAAATVTYTMSIHPDVISEDARPVFRTLASWHPTGVNLFQRIVVEYYLSNVDTQAQMVGSTLRIPLAYTQGQWNTYQMAITDDLELYAPNWDGRDHTLRHQYLGIESRNGAQGIAYFDEFHIDHVDEFHDLWAVQASMMGSVEAMVPAVAQYQGVEQSMTPRHMCEYGDVVLHDIFAVQMASGFVDPEGVISGWMAMHDWVGEYLVDSAHVRGNVVSYAHAFGTKTQPISATPTKEQTLAKLLDERLHNADILEVGYRLRGVRVGEFLWVWDELAKVGLMPVGVGVRDIHTTKPTSPWIRPAHNTFDSWIWSQSLHKDDMLAGLASGRVYFGEIQEFDGELDLTTDRGFRMGHIVLTDRNSDVVHLQLDGATVGDELRVIEYGIETQTMAIGTASLVHSWPVTIDALDGTFTRVEVWDPDIQPVAPYADAWPEVVYSNPINYVRGLPAEGIPGERAAIDLGGILCTEMARFRLMGAQIIRGGAEDTLRIDGIGFNGEGWMDIDLGAVGGATGVTLGGGMLGGWTQNAMVVSLSGLEQSGWIEITFASQCGADANGDGVVDVNDVSYVLFRLGDSGASVPGDANGDGIVGLNDISYVLFRLGTQCGP